MGIYSQGGHWALGRTENSSLDLGAGTQGDLDFVFCAVKAQHLTEVLS